MKEILPASHVLRRSSRRKMVPRVGSVGTGYHHASRASPCFCSPRARISEPAREVRLSRQRLRRVTCLFRLHGCGNRLFPAESFPLAKLVCRPNRRPPATRFPPPPCLSSPAVTSLRTRGPLAGAHGWLTARKSATGRCAAGPQSGRRGVRRRRRVEQTSVGAPPGLARGPKRLVAGRRSEAARQPAKWAGFLAGLRRIARRVVAPIVACVITPPHPPTSFCLERCFGRSSHPTAKDALEPPHPKRVPNDANDGVVAHESRRTHALCPEGAEPL
jgi:hypothetical protein